LVPPGCEALSAERPLSFLAAGAAVWTFAGRLPASVLGASAATDSLSLLPGNMLFLLNLFEGMSVLRIESPF
jgi:hypothetical protein